MKKYHYLLAVAILINLVYLFINSVYFAIIPYSISTTIILYTLYDNQLKQVERIKKIVIYSCYSVTLSIGIFQLAYRDMPYPKSIFFPAIVGVFFGFNIWLSPQLRKHK